MLDTVNELDIELLLHPPYSPDLAICDFWLFPNIKNRLYGQKYESLEDLRWAINRHLEEMSCDGLQHVLQSWVEQWNKCKLCQGHYFEK